MADTLTITDNRTGKQYEVPINDSTIRALDLRQIKVTEDEFGLMTYDPAYQNTASCKSRITFIDGDKGILRYRGLPHRAAGRAQYVRRDVLSALERRIAHRVAAGRLEPETPVACDASREHQEVHGGFSGTTPTPWASS